MFCCCVGENILFNIRNYAWHIKEGCLAWMHLNSLSWQFVLLMRCYWEWKPFCRLASSAIWCGNESPPSQGHRICLSLSPVEGDPSLWQKLQLELCWKGLCSPVCGCGMGKKPLWEQNAYTCLLKLLRTEFFKCLKSILSCIYFNSYELCIIHYNLCYAIFSPQPVLLPAFTLIWQIQLHNQISLFPSE